MIFDNSNIKIEALQSKLFDEKGISLSILRLDTIHPIISGNKLFKLKYFLEEAVASSHKKIITFGGAYSNHLAATAYACKILGIKCIGIVRGEEPTTLSHTLKLCKHDGMVLKFVSRENYNKKEDKLFLDMLEDEFGESIIIPEGGYHPTGAKGASLIMDLTPDNTTHICCAMGTATTLAGLMLKSNTTQKIIGVSVLKGIENFKNSISFLTNNKVDFKQLEILQEYHFGGYAKKNVELISFMNEVYEQHQLPTDFVYTAKMLYGIIDQIKKGKFSPGDNILCIHTGGLQGNQSLPTGTLFF